MKKGSAPQLAAAWWHSNQPDGLATARGLKTALDGYETARDKLKDSGTEAALKVATKALKDVEDAVDAVLAEAAKLLKAPPKKGPFDAADVEETVKALKKCPALYAAARDALDDMAEEEQGEFADPEAYRAHLRKALRRLKGGKPTHFAFAAGKKAPQHRLALHRSSSGRTLAGLLTQQTGLHATTFGTATAHPEQADTIVLAIEGKQLAGLKKKAERLLKAFKPLPFAHVLLQVEGVRVEDLPDPEDTDTDDLYDRDEAPIPVPPPMDAGLLAGALGQMMRRIQAASGGDAQVQAALVKLATAARKALGDGNLAQAAAEMDQLAEALRMAEARVSENVKPDEPGKPNTDGPAIAVAKAVRLWDETRKQVRQQLQALERAIIEQASDESDFAEIKTRAPVLEQVLERLDDSLSAKLNQIYSVPDPAARDKLRGEAREIVLGYSAYAATEPLMAALDRNPFGVAINAQARVAATLDAILLHI